MAIITLQPGANQTPDATLGGLAMTTPTNTGHASSTASCSDAGASQTKSMRWFTIPAAISGQRISVTLKVTHTSSGALTGAGASNLFRVSYSVNGGSSWTDAVNRESFTSSQGPTVLSVTLSIAQDTSQVQVRDVLIVATNDNGESASATATISGVQVEVLTQDGAIVVM